MEESSGSHTDFKTEEKKTILLAHPRSGSSNLFHILNLHPALNLLEEPFNQTHHTWKTANKNYRSRIQDIASFDAVLTDIFKRYNGFKLLNYQLDEDYLQHFLLQTDLRIIFLRRQNLLQSIVSNLIALQTGLWKKWEQTESLEQRYAQLKPLDIEDIQARSDGLRIGLEYCEAILAQRPKGTTLKLTYETLYFAPFEAQLNDLNIIFSFLNLQPIADEQINYFLRPEKSKLNSIESYRFIPNAEEINRECGTDQAGWLLA